MATPEIKKEKKSKLKGFCESLRGAVICGSGFLLLFVMGIGILLKGVARIFGKRKGRRWDLT